MDTHPWGTASCPDFDLAVRWPGGRVPASLIVDDPMPGLNPMREHEPGHPHRPEVPNAVLARFADLSERHGLQGKFSVVPWPLALGRLDRPETLPPPARAALPGFLELVRERVAPRFDLTEKSAAQAPAFRHGYKPRRRPLPEHPSRNMLLVAAWQPNVGRCAGKSSGA